MPHTSLDRKKIGLIFLVAGSIFSGALIGVWVALTYDLPQIRDLESFQPSAVTRIYSADKVLLSELFVEKRRES